MRRKFDVSIEGFETMPSAIHEAIFGFKPISWSTNAVGFPRARCGCVLARPWELSFPRPQKNVSRD